MTFLARFLPSLIPGLQAFLNPWVLLGIIAVATAGFTAGWKVESWRWDASEKAAAEASLKAVQAFFDREKANNQRVAAGLNADRARLEQDRTDYQEALNAARRNGPILKASCPNNPPGGQGAPGGSLAVAGAPSGGAAASDVGAAGVVCDAACIRLWHDGLAQGLSGAYGGWRADAANSAPDSIAADDLFSNAGANFAGCNAIRSVALGWQRKACLEGWWKGPECSTLLKGN